MRLSDEVTGAHRLFLLGPWLAQAKAMATGTEEQARLEHSARALITTWADRATADGGSLANYAGRDWHGLIGEVHLPQWQAYLDELADALAADRPPKTFDWYALEEPWTRARTTPPLRPTTDAYRTARRVHDTLAKAPYQGTVTVTADPPALPPGGRATVTAALRNVNGLRATGRVDFALTGVAATASGPVSLPSLPPGGSGRARWQVTAPAGPQNAPCTRSPTTSPSTTARRASPGSARRGTAPCTWRGRWTTDCGPSPPMRRFSASWATGWPSTAGARTSGRPPQSSARPTGRARSPRAAR